jgi:hypothetical protein
MMSWEQSDAGVGTKVPIRNDEHHLNLILRYNLAGTIYKIRTPSDPAEANPI